MAYQQREGQGSLFKNEKQNDRQPDFRGNILIKGVTYSISAWNRTSQNGREYISLQAEERSSDAQQGYQQRPSYTPAAPSEVAPPPSLDDLTAAAAPEDLPF